MIERYQTDAMAALWNEEAKFERWTQVEVAACEAFHARGEISDDEMAIIKEKAHHQSAAHVREHEKVTNHDVVAFVRSVSEMVGEPACRHLHRGLTSSDVVDTANGIALRDSLKVIIESVKVLQQAIAKRALEHKLTPCAGRTHGIHAEPTSFGLRLAGWHTELARNIERLEAALSEVAYGKMSGAVGTFSQTDPEFESFVVQQLGLQAEPVATQVVPRDRHASTLSALSLLGGGLERFATEIRSLQRTDLREAEEGFRKGQTGSSAMPHKRNPITCERVSGMARLLRSYMLSAHENIALWHDRDISHSSVERVIFPDAFHCAHYMVLQFTRVIENLRVYPDNMMENIDRTGGLLFSQNVLGCLLKAGMERQEAYKIVQRAAMNVWEGEFATFRQALEDEKTIQEKLGPSDLDRAFELTPYLRHIDTLFKRAGITSEE